MIIVCSLDGDVCAYRMNVATAETQSACERLGYLVAGGTLERSYGRFDIGEITVTCEPIREVAAVMPPSPTIGR